MIIPNTLNPELKADTITRERMQPLHLQLYERGANTIRKINGYELLPGGIIRIFEDDYNRKYAQALIRILHCSGIYDNTGQLLFEGDVVDLMYATRTFRGVINFQEGAFVCEGLNEVIHEWPNSMQIGKCGNIFTDPLALQVATQ